MKRRRISIILSVLMALLMIPQTVFAEDILQRDLEGAAAYTLKTISDPAFGAEWSIIALAGSDTELPTGYMGRYYKNTEKTIIENNGVLSTSRYTEYSRAVLGITASGHDASNVGGYDLTEKISDVAQVKKQGINGPVFALLALDSADYASDSRQAYVDFLLGRQLADGGWAYSGDLADADMTAMTLQALSSYTGQEEVAEAVKKGVACLAELQGDDGLYESYGDNSSESLSQVIIALTALGIDPADDRFVKNGHLLIDGLLSFQLEDGSFCHVKGKGSDGLATVQAFLALASVWRIEQGIPYIYKYGKEYISQIKYDFVDTFRHWAAADIEKACAAGLFAGTSADTFSPDVSMDRAMLVTVLWRMSGKPASNGAAAFSDVKSDTYYANAVAWASANKIVSGYGGGVFGPTDLITREQMASILYRYAEFSNIDVSKRADLSQYEDIGNLSSWASDSMSWANASGLIRGTGSTTISPKGNATRAMAAAILVRYQDLDR